MLVKSSHASGSLEDILKVQYISFTIRVATLHACCYTVVFPDIDPLQSTKCCSTKHGNSPRLYNIDEILKMNHSEPMLDMKP